MQWFFDQLKKEWQLIKAAPVSFLVVSMLALGMSFSFCRWIYQERLAGKDDLLGLYREKLGIAPHDKTAYSAMRNSQLKAKAMELVRDIREFAGKKSEASRTLAEKQWEAMVATQSAEDRQKVWRQYSSQLLRTSTVDEEYASRFRATVIAVRDEIISRLPKDGSVKPAIDQASHWYPVNPIGVGLVADDLAARGSSNSWCQNM